MRSALMFAFLVALSSLAAAQDATIHVYRDAAKLYAAAVSPSIYVDGREVARLSNGHYFEVRVTPGPHVISMEYTRGAVHPG